MSPHWEIPQQTGIAHGRLYVSNVAVSGVTGRPAFVRKTCCREHDVGHLCLRSICLTGYAVTGVRFGDVFYPRWRFDLHVLSQVAADVNHDGYIHLL